MIKNPPLPHYIRQWREVKQLKQELLAEKINVSPSTLSCIENYKSDIGLNRLHKIAFHLEIDTKKLLVNPAEMLSHAN